MLRSFFASFLVLLGTAWPAFADENYNIQNVARLEILSGYPTSNGHMVAARIKLKQGWKTYWRSPGSNGIPPTFDWSGSKNVSSVSYHWPEPSVFLTDGIQTIGYKGELLLPITIKAKNPGEPLHLRGKVAFGVCDDVCLPAQAKFSLTVAGTNTSDRKAIKTALRQRPKSAKSAGVRSLSCEITPIEDGFRIVATLKTQKPINKQTISVFEVPGLDIWIEQDQIVANGNRISASANLFSYGSSALILDRSKITLNLLGGSRAIEMLGCPV